MPEPTTLRPLVRPRALPERAHVAVLAASGPSEPARIEKAARAIEARGHTVTLASNIASRHMGYLAGSDDERLAELNRLLRSPEYDAFFFARGGYGAMRILPGVDYRAVAADPRPIVGFSDVTALHQAIATHAHVATFHGPMLNLDFHDGLSEDRERWFWSMLAGEAPLARELAPGDVIVEGEAEGFLFGGCLALTAALVGTPYDFWIDGGLWFWEDTDEPLYRLDRMLTHLSLSGRLERVGGVIVGALKGCGTDEEVAELLRDRLGPLGVPVVRNVPFGHHGNNLMLPIGTPARIRTGERTLTITEPAVARGG